MNLLSCDTALPRRLDDVNGFDCAGRVLDPPLRLLFPYGLRKKFKVAHLSQSKRNLDRLCSR